jgi:hypothetical protein
LFAKSYEPHRQAGEQHAKALLLERQAAGLRAEEKRLRAEQEALATPRGQQEEARRQGYIWPGERRVVFVSPESAPVPVSAPRQTR